LGGISERGKEIKRRRKRRQKLAIMARKLKKASASERSVIAYKIRRLSPGADVVLQNMQIEER